MARYDKYEPFANGYRARLAANFAYTASLPDFVHADLNKVWSVGLSNTGLVVFNAAIAAVRGVLILSRPKAVGDVVDVMTSGEILDFVLANGSAAAAGTEYFAAAAGSYGTAAPGAGVNGTSIGWTTTADRLIVRVQKAQG